MSIARAERKTGLLYFLEYFNRHSPRHAFVVALYTLPAVTHYFLCLIRQSYKAIYLVICDNSALYYSTREVYAVFIMLLKTVTVSCNLRR